MFSRLCLIAPIALVMAACGGGEGDPVFTPPGSNSVPIAAADTARIRPGMPADIDVLDNDRDGDGDDLTIELPAAHASATFEVVASRLRVTPAAGFGGTLTFSYRVRDSHGAYSAPANVVVDVGPIARALMVLAPAPSATPPVGSPRFVVAGTPSDDPLELLTFGTCNQQSWAYLTSDARRLLGRSCLSPTRSDIFLSQPRATTLTSPTLVYGNAPLASGLVILGNFAEFLVAERVSNPDVLTLGSTYDLVRVDIVQGTVMQRMPLTGIDHVSLVRPGGPRRVLLVARDTNGDQGHFIADIDAGTVRRVTPPEDIDIESSMLSPNGRYLVSNWPLPAEIIGYDTEGPVQRQTLWTVPDSSPLSYVTNMQFIAGPAATLLVESMNLATRETVVWRVPLATPEEAREVVRFTAGPVHLRMLVRDGVGVYGADGGSGRTHLNRVDIFTGEILEPLTPSGGAAIESVDWFTGTTLLFTMRDDGQTRRGAWIRTDAPGVVRIVAPTLEAELFSLSIDQEETTIGLRAPNASGVTSGWLVDVNLPSMAFPVASALQPGEVVSMVQSLGPPDP